jgi:hypothetical protein
MFKEFTIEFIIAILCELQSKDTKKIEEIFSPFLDQRVDIKKHTYWPLNSDIISMTLEKRTTLGKYWQSSYKVRVGSYITPERIKVLDGNHRDAICMLLVTNPETLDRLLDKKLRLLVNVLCLKNIKIPVNIHQIFYSLFNLQEVQIDDCMWSSKLKLDHFPSEGNYKFNNLHLIGGARIQFPDFKSFKAKCTVKNNYIVQNPYSEESNIILRFGNKLDHL